MISNFVWFRREDGRRVLIDPARIDVIHPDEEKKKQGGTLDYAFMRLQLTGGGHVNVTGESLEGLRLKMTSGGLHTVIFNHEETLPDPEVKVDLRRTANQG